MTLPGAEAALRSSGHRAMSVDEARSLRALIQEHCGLAFGEDLTYLLESRLAPLLARHGLADFAAYHRLLRGGGAGSPELEAAIEALATHETYLFREPHQLRAFAEELLPELADRNRRQRRLRVWSAGCSTGEEAYTVAALLLGTGLFGGWEVDVLGTDLVRGVVDVARAGVYGPGAFREAEAEALRPWFRAEGARWRVRDELRRVVRFARQNLLDEGATSLVDPVDVVFCRNVLIHFEAGARRRALRTFARKLRPGGYLLLGHAESLRLVPDGLERVQLRSDIVYRKPARPA